MEKDRREVSIARKRLCSLWRLLPNNHQRDRYGRHDYRIRSRSRRRPSGCSGDFKAVFAGISTRPRIVYCHQLVPTLAWIVSNLAGLMENGGDVKNLLLNSALGDLSRQQIPVFCSLTPPELHKDQHNIVLK